MHSTLGIWLQAGIESNLDQNGWVRVVKDLTSVLLFPKRKLRVKNSITSSELKLKGASKGRCFP